MTDYRNAQDHEPDYDDDWHAMVVGDVTPRNHQPVEQPTESNLATRERLKARGKRGRRPAADIVALDDARHRSLRAMARTIDRETTVKGRIITLKPGQVASSYSFLAKRWQVTKKEAEGTIQRLLSRNCISVASQSLGHHVNVYDTNGTAWLKTWPDIQQALKKRRFDKAIKHKGSASTACIDIIRKNRGGMPGVMCPNLTHKSAQYQSVKFIGEEKKEPGGVSVESGTEPAAFAATAVIDQDGMLADPVAAFAARSSGSVLTPAQPVIEAEIVPDGERFASRSKVACQDGTSIDGELLTPHRACGAIPDPRDAIHARELLWGQVRAYLASQPGATDASVRSQLGKLRKSGDDLAIVRAAVTAQRTNVIDPLAYMRGVLKANTGNRSGRSYSNAADVFASVFQQERNAHDKPHEI